MKCLELKRATEKDVDELLRIEQESFRFPWSRRLLISELANPLNHYYLARQDAICVGFGGISLIEDEGHINNLAVKKKYRQKRVGTALLIQLLKLAYEKQIRSVGLEVSVNNQAALKLYISFGFAPIGIRKNYYEKEREDAFYMQLDDTSLFFKGEKLTLIESMIKRDYDIKYS